MRELPVIRQNGFAVLEKKPPAENYNPPYRGGGGPMCDWPLPWEGDAFTRALIDEAQEKWGWYSCHCESLEVVPDWPWILRYVERCRDLNIDADVYFLGDKLETFDADLRKANIAPWKAIIMGFDCIGYPGYSYLYDDNAYTFLEEERPKLRQIEQTLKTRGIRLKRRLRFNEYGLFYTAAEAQYYVTLRRAAINAGVFDFETEEGTACGIEDGCPDFVVRCARIEP